MPRFVPAVLVAVALLLLPGSALAGRLIVTGHDAELHCSSGQTAQCPWLKVAVDYVRATAPDPTKPVLLLDYDTSGADQPTMLMDAMNAAYNGTPPPFKVDEPRTPAFAAEPLNTGAYSAVVVASDYTCGGCDLNYNTNFDSNLTPDSDAINARKPDFATFFNQGGGIVALAGASHGDGDPSDGPDNYYSFVPIPLGGLQVVEPFTLTAAGRAIGFTDDPTADNSMINCCATHNSFTIPPAGSPLHVLEYDSSSPPGAETLGADGSITNNTIVAPPVEGKTANAATESGKVFVKLPKSAAAKAKYGWARGAASNGFVPLGQIRSIPIGSTLDTRRGQVRLTMARSLHATQVGHFKKGMFKLAQGKKNPLTTLTLTGGNLKGCSTKVPKGGAAKVTAARHRGRRLFSHVKGRFRTRGRSSSATVRGTQWLQKDSCSGSLTKVTQGTVVVRDFAKHKTVTVHKGHSYFARALRRARH